MEPTESNENLGARVGFGRKEGRKRGKRGTIRIDFGSPQGGEKKGRYYC